MYMQTLFAECCTLYNNRELSEARASSSDLQRAVQALQEDKAALEQV
jgi:hypothetical protein